MCPIDKNMPNYYKMQKNDKQEKDRKLGWNAGKSEVRRQKARKIESWKVEVGILKTKYKPENCEYEKVSSFKHRITHLTGKYADFCTGMTQKPKVNLCSGEICGRTIYLPKLILPGWLHLYCGFVLYPRRSCVHQIAPCPLAPPWCVIVIPPGCIWVSPITVHARLSLTPRPPLVTSRGSTQYLSFCKKKCSQCDSSC